MIKKIGLGMSLILLLAFTAGCAKDYQIPEEELTQGIEDAMVVVTAQGLRLADEHVPDVATYLYPAFQLTASVGQLYLDGEASGGDFAETLRRLLFTANDVLLYIEDETTLESMKIAFNILGGFAESLLEKQEIPDSAKPYVRGVVNGIAIGLDQYDDSREGEQ